MTAATAMKVGQAAGTRFLRGTHRHRVVIGKDTRLSGYMLENALVAGFTSVGMDVIMTGPLPTPAIALLTRRDRQEASALREGDSRLPAHGLRRAVAADAGDAGARACRVQADALRRESAGPRDRKSTRLNSSH